MTTYPEIPLETDVDSHDELLVSKNTSPKRVTVSTLGDAIASGLASVATSGSYNDLSDLPPLGSAASFDTDDFVSAILSQLYSSLPAIATSGDAGDLAGALPDAVFPDTLPAVDGSNLTGLSIDQISGLEGVTRLKGDWDPSSGAFPDESSYPEDTPVQAGYQWIVSEDGSLDGQQFVAGDYIIAAINNPSTDTFSGNWIRESNSRSASVLTKSEHRTLYVSPDGAPNANGENRTQAVPTLEHARDLMIASGEPTTVMLCPGEYTSAGHIDMPDNLRGIIGTGHPRSTIIRPSAGNEVKNVLRLGNGGYVTGVSFEGWQVDSLDDPTEGFAVSFRPGAVIVRTVFAFNIAVFRARPASLIPPPLDRENGNPLVGTGPGVALADKSVVSQYSVFPQIMLWGATPVCPNGLGYVAKNGAFLNGINAVALWMHKHYMALGGGEIILTNCASQFGDYTLWAEGSTLEVEPAETSAPLVTDNAAADAVQANASAIIDQMWSDLVAAGYGNVDETATRRDAGLFLLSVEYDLRSGQQESVRRFVKGLFDYKGDFVAPASALDAFIFSFENMRDQIKALGAVGASAGAMMDGLTALVADTLQSPAKRTKPSKITSVGHQWNNTMAGVNGRALDRPALPVRDSIIERDLGVVTYAGIDDLGNQYFPGGAVVNPNTGKLEGPPIGRTIDPRARLAALIAGGQA